jgi:putative membrane protein
MRKSISSLVSALALATLLVPGATLAAKEEATKQAPKAQDFVMQAGQDGMAEVTLGQLADTKAASAEVKAFGRKMAEEHAKANKELTDLANGKNIAAPTAPAPKHQALFDRLNRLSGGEFDRAYMQAMVTDHDNAVGLFRKFAAEGDDAELKAWAKKTLPTLEEHERHANDLAAKVGVDRSASIAY